MVVVVGAQLAAVVVSDVVEPKFEIVPGAADVELGVGIVELFADMPPIDCIEEVDEAEDAGGGTMGCTKYCG